MIPDPFIREREGVDALQEGYFLLKLSGLRIDVPIRIWFGQPADPLDPTVLLDRAPRWQIEINGILLGDPENPPLISGQPVDDIVRFWPRCSADRIEEAEYAYRIDRAQYAEDYDPSDPFARTGGRVNPLTASLP
jgi:hypothetical protein